jgi:hypothetical protein
MIQHVVGRDAGINAEILRKIAQRLTQQLRLGDDVDVPEADCAFAWCLSVATVRISVDLPAPLGPSSPNMPRGMDSVTWSSARVPLA